MNRFIVKLTLALAVLEGSVEVTKKDEVWLKEPLLIVAKSLELYDDRETQYYFSEYAPDEFFTDCIVQMQDRYKELQDAPRLMGFEDWGVTPEELDANIALNVNYRFQLKEMKCFYPPYRVGEIETTEEENDKLYRLMDLLKCGLSNTYYVSARRGWMMELRRHMGDEAFYARRQIPATPYWRIKNGF